MVSQVDWQNRAHFFGVAANVMRRILVDHARRHSARHRRSDVPLFLRPDAAGAIDAFSTDGGASQSVLRDERPSQANLGSLFADAAGRPYVAEAACQWLSNDQSELLEAALKKANVPVAFHAVKGGGHGGFTDDRIGPMVTTFIADHLAGPQWR